MNGMGPVDVVLFTVKLYDTESAIAHLPPLIGPETVVVPFQNGVDAVDRLMRAVGRENGFCQACFTGYYPISVDPLNVKTGFEQGIKV